MFIPVLVFKIDQLFPIHKGVIPPTFLIFKVDVVVAFDKLIDDKANVLFSIVLKPLLLKLMIELS